MPRFLYFKLLTLGGSSACFLLFEEPFEKKSGLLYWSASLHRDVASSPKPLGREESDLPLLKLKFSITLVLLFPNCLYNKIMDTLEVYLAKIPIL